MGSSNPREEQTNREFHSFLEDVTTESPAPSSIPSPAKKFPSPPPRTAKAPRVLDPLAEALLPTAMSCREALDAAHYCQSLGGQFINVYRYGKWRDCMSKWSDLKYCMGMKSYRGTDKGDLIRAHYREKEWAKYGRPGAGEGKSSEDVWEGRKTMRGWGSTFAEKEPQLDDKMEDIVGEGRLAR